MKRRPAVLAVVPPGGGRELRAVLGRDAALELVGVAHGAADALEAVERQSPDLVALDASLTAGAGADLFRELSRRRPRPAVMIVGGRRDADPIVRGAGSLAIERFVDAGSPGSGGGRTGLLERGLLPRLHALFERTARGVDGVPGSGLREAPAVRLLAVGVSTGGPDALMSLLGALPGTLPVPVLVVQHMPAAFVPKLARRLDAASALDVGEARDGEALRPGTVRIAPGAAHLRVERRGGELVAGLAGGPPENACRPAVDVLFRSAARTLGSAALGLVMTGMGRDGYLGSRALVLTGARVLVQDETSSIVWGMPGLVSRAGLACASVPLARLPDEVLERVGHGGAAPGAARAAGAA